MTIILIIVGAVILFNLLLRLYARFSVGERSSTRNVTRVFGMFFSWLIKLWQLFWKVIILIVIGCIIWWFVSNML